MIGDMGASHDFSKHKRKPKDSSKENGDKPISFRPRGDTHFFIEALREKLNKDKNEGGLYEDWDNTSVLLNQIIKMAYASYLQDCVKKEK